MPTNIQQLKREGLAARATWHFGDDELPLRADDPTSIVADQIRDIEAFTLRCPKCHSAMLNAGYLCGRCVSGVERYEP